MTDNNPLVSVIIPTHNRCDSLQRTLNSLDRQTYPNHQYEVIVVADGCTDKTVENTSKVVRSLKLRIIEQPKSGAAVARNVGARNAEGRFLLFLDDDVVSKPDLIEAHYKTHQNNPGHVVIGPYLLTKLQTQFPSNSAFFLVEEIFSNMSRPYHRFTYRDLISGNLSIEAELFSILVDSIHRFVGPEVRTGS
jgi:glycosyltransferase involved in cell wall biosynthesis